MEQTLGHEAKVKKLKFVADYVQMNTKPKNIQINEPMNFEILEKHTPNSNRYFWEGEGTLCKVLISFFCISL